MMVLWIETKTLFLSYLNSGEFLLKTEEQDFCMPLCPRALLSQAQSYFALKMMVFLPFLSEVAPLYLNTALLVMFFGSVLTLWFCKFFSILFIQSSSWYHFILLYI